MKDKTDFDSVSINEYKKGATAEIVDGGTLLVMIDNIEEIDKSFFEKVLEFLNEFPKVVTLSFSNCNLGNDGMKQLVEAIKNVPPLQINTLDLSYSGSETDQHLGLTMFQELTQKQLPNLQDLKLKGLTQLNQTQLIDNGATIKHNFPKLTTVDFSDSGVKDEDIGKFKRAWEENDKLGKIKLAVTPSGVLEEQDVDQLNKIISCIKDKGEKITAICNLSEGRKVGNEERMCLTEAADFLNKLAEGMQKFVNTYPEDRRKAAQQDTDNKKEENKRQKYSQSWRGRFRKDMCKRLRDLGKIIDDKFTRPLKKGIQENKVLNSLKELFRNIYKAIAISIVSVLKSTKAWGDVAGATIRLGQDIGNTVTQLVNKSKNRGYARA